MRAREAAEHATTIQALGVSMSPSTWFEWDGNPSNAPLLVVTRVDDGKQVGLFALVEPDFSGTAFFARRLRRYPEAMTLLLASPADIFDEVDPDEDFVGVGTAMLDTVRVRYEQVGSHLSR